MYFWSSNPPTYSEAFLTHKKLSFKPPSSPSKASVFLFIGNYTFNIHNRNIDIILAPRIKTEHQILPCFSITRTTRTTRTIYFTILYKLPQLKFIILFPHLVNNPFTKTRTHKLAHSPCLFPICGKLQFYLY